ncbi:MAG: hypothetical protein OIF32_02480 [Campylobacterales bacterium]|nr:hypothetical protein [Campylobacterales bacterium]
MAIKKIPILFILIFFYGCETQTLVKEGNFNKKPLTFDFKTTKDADCGMTVSGLKFSAQLISEDGKTWFFHDPGSLPMFLKKTEIKNPTIWFYTMDTNRYIKAEDTWFSLTDETPMKYGFGAYEQREEKFIDYETMKLRMFRGENLTNPQIKKRLLGNS